MSPKRSSAEGAEDWTGCTTLRGRFGCGMEFVNGPPDRIWRAFSAGVLLLTYPRPRKLSLGYHLSRLRR
jgi:hypothetical protein